MKQIYLSTAIALVLCVSANLAASQTAPNTTQPNAANPIDVQAAPASTDNKAQIQTDTQNANGASNTKTPSRPIPSSTSNTTTDNDTRRQQQLESVQVNASSLSRGGGLMSVQSAPTAVSTITREAITQAGPGSNFTQLIQTIPGVDSSTDDITGLSNGNYSIRGYTNSEIGVAVNGAPVSDSGSYNIYATEYGDSENIGDITVLAGKPDLDLPNSGAAGGNIAWSTIDPTHDFNVLMTQTFGNNGYNRTFMRVNTGDIGPVRSWVSYSTNNVDLWRGHGSLDVQKVDAKSIWTINDDNFVSGSVQYSHQLNDQYYGVGKAQVAQNGYYYNYTPYNLSTPSGNSNAWMLHGNPFDSVLLSLDGEFKLSDDIHLSVIPYFEYGNGGGGGGATFTESTSPANKYQAVNQDLNSDGLVTDGTKFTEYSFSQTTTWRPGIIAKINENFGNNDSLEYGIWYENPRQEQNQNFSLINPQTGFPYSFWSNAPSVALRYPDGNPQYAYLEYTDTKIAKAFATNTWTPTDQITVVAGVAYLHAERSGYDFQKPYAPNVQVFNTDASWSKFLPTAAVKFAPDERNQFYVSIGKTFRVPTNASLALNGVGNKYDSNAGLSTTPETAWTTDIGYRFYTDDVAISADIYNSNFSNKQITGFDQIANTAVYTNIPKSTLRGFNGEASYQLTDFLKAYASYTYTQATIESNLFAGSGDGTFPTKGKQLANTPRNMLRTSLQYTQGPLWAALIGEYTSSRYGDFMSTEKVGGYPTFNINSGWKFPNIGLFANPYIKLNIYNITDRRAFINANGISLLADVANKGNYIDPSNGKNDLYASAPYYSLLQPRAYMVTFGTTFF